MKKLEIGGNLFVEKVKIDPKTNVPVVTDEGLPEMEQIVRSIKSELIRILKSSSYQGFGAIEMHEIIQKISEQAEGFIILDDGDYDKVRQQIDNPQFSCTVSYVPLLKAIRDATDIDPKDLEEKSKKPAKKGGGNNGSAESSD